MVKFSVITVCFNSVSTIESTFNSVAALTNDFDIQHIFVDGGSSDGTQQLLEDFNKHIHCEIVIDKDDGIFDAMNKGADLATGDFLLFLNSDDSYIYDECAKFLSSILCSDEIVFADIFLLDDGCRIPVRSRHPVVKSQFYNLPIHHPSSAVRRDVFFNLSKFNCFYKYSSDFDFFLRAFISKADFRYIPTYPSVMASGGAGSIHKFIALREQRHSLFRNKCYLGLLFAYMRFYYHIFWHYFNSTFSPVLYSKWRLLRSRLFKNF